MGRGVTWGGTTKGDWEIGRVRRYHLERREDEKGDGGRTTLGAVFRELGRRVIAIDTRAITLTPGERERTSGLFGGLYSVGEKGTRLVERSEKKEKRGVRI